MTTSIMTLVGTTISNPQSGPLAIHPGVRRGTRHLYDLSRPSSYPSQVNPTSGAQVINVAAPTDTPGSFQGDPSRLFTNGGGIDWQNTQAGDNTYIRSTVVPINTYVHPLIIVWAGLRAGAEHQGIIGQAEGYGDATRNSWALTGGPDGKTPLLWLYASDGSGGVWTPSFGSHPGLHQLAADLDYPTGTITLYVDGVQVGTTVFPAGFGGLRAPTQRLGIGAWTGEGITYAPYRGKYYGHTITDVAAGPRSAAQVIADDWALNSPRYS